MVLSPTWPAPSMAESRPARKLCVDHPVSFCSGWFVNWTMVVLFAWFAVQPNVTWHLAYPCCVSSLSFLR